MIKARRNQFNYSVHQILKLKEHLDNRMTRLEACERVQIKPTSSYRFVNILNDFTPAALRILRKYSQDWKEHYDRRSEDQGEPPERER